jgi:hypothetical protein
MAKVSDTSRGRRNVKLSQTESALVFSQDGVHNVLSTESRQFIDDMLTKGEETAFAGITPEKFWTVVLPAVTYVKMAAYVKEVQAANNPQPEDTQLDGAPVDAATTQAMPETVADTESDTEQPETPIEAFDG